MSENALYILVGMIASGQSTYCREKAQDGFIITNDDALVTMIHGGDYTLYDKALKPIYKTVETNLIYSALTMGKNVIVDRTNLTKKTRQRYIQIAASLDIPSIAVIFPFETPLTHAIRRANSCDRGYSEAYWNHVAEFHLSTYEEVSLDEGLIKAIEYEDSGRYQIRLPGRSNDSKD